MNNKIFNSRFVCVFFCLLAAIFCTNEACAIEIYVRYYLDGKDYRQNGQYKEAIKAFAMAIIEKPEEQKRVRYYGMQYGEYQPHMEKGICHFHLKQYEAAIEELQTSLEQIRNAEAQRYLDLAKTEFEKSAKDGGMEAVDTPEELTRIREAKSENHYAVAVIIGNRDYHDGDIPAAQYAIRDAAMMKKYLIKTFGYREGNIIYKTNATKGALETIFGSALSRKGALYDVITPGRSDLFVYYSGHGAPNPETKKGFILPVDGSANNVSISGYSIDLLYENLSKLQTRSTTVVMDACFSGALVFKKASPVGIFIVNPLVAHPNTTIMNSSSGTQLSSWYPQKGHGLFTYYFLLGLTGRADENNDNRISFSEFSFYLAENVSYMARQLYPGRKQTPTFETQNKDNIIVTYK